MTTKITPALTQEVVEMRNLIIDHLVELIGLANVHHRATVVSPNLFELHIDFELGDKALWICINQDRRVIVHRHYKTRYQREVFNVSFDEVKLRWLAAILLDR